jgi:hypothetical protein
VDSTSASVDPGAMLRFGVWRYTLFRSAFSTMTVVTDCRYR